MNPFSLFVVFLIVWWTVLFTVLPRNIKGQAESNDVVKGTEPGAPVDSNIKDKFILTTKIAAVIWVLVCGLIWSDLVSWDMFGDWFRRR